MAKLKYYLYYLDKKIPLVPGSTYTIGRTRDNNICLPGATTSRYHARIFWNNKRFIIEDTGSTNGIFVNGRKYLQYTLSDRDHIIIGISYLVFREYDSKAGEDKVLDHEISDTLVIERQIAYLLKEIGDKKICTALLKLKRSVNKAKHKMNVLANCDRLTGLYNRRFFDQELKKEIERVRRYTYPLSLFMIDIDHFKKVNDNYGHQKGDKALAAVAAIILENTRCNDLVARYGGEEFVVVMPEMKVENSTVVAENMRRLIETKSLKRTGIRITVSIGIAIYTKTDSLSRFIAKADKALYEAKKRGRNRVILYAKK